MDGYQVLTLEDVIDSADIFVTATGNLDVITVEHMRAMKDRAIVANIGHFDSEIQVAALHLDKIGVKLTRLTEKQAAYIGVGSHGPFKPEHYRY